MSKFRIDVLPMLGLNNLVAPTQAPNATLLSDDYSDTNFGVFFDSDHWLFITPAVSTEVPQDMDLVAAH